MSQVSLGHFLARVAQERELQHRLRRCSVVEAAALAQSLGFDVRCGDLLRYESRAFAWPLSDNEYELLARLQRPRPHWWQRCWQAEPGNREQDDDNNKRQPARQPTRS